MKIKSEVIWATLLIVTAAIFFYLGSTTGSLEHQEILESEIEEKSEKITVLENKIQQLSDELTSRGIFSYPQATVVHDKGDFEAKVLIMLNGREPIPNLEIERRIITDFPINADANSEADPITRTTNIGTLTAHNPVAFDVDDFQTDIAMDLKFKSERNQWFQYIRTNKTAGGEIKTFWVITNGNSEVIDKHIDEGYPTDDKGNLYFGRNMEVKYSDIKMNSTFWPETF